MTSIARREEATMYRPVDQRLIIAFRLSVSVRWPSAALVRRPAALAGRIVAALPRPAPATVRRLARRLAIAGVFALAVVLVATVPALVTRLALRNDLWDLSRFFDGRAEPPAVPGLSLLLARWWCWPPSRRPAAAITTTGRSAPPGYAEATYSPLARRRKPSARTSR